VVSSKVLCQGIQVDVSLLSRAVVIRECEDAAAGTAVALPSRGALEGAEEEFIDFVVLGIWDGCFLGHDGDRDLEILRFGQARPRCLLIWLNVTWRMHCGTVSYLFADSLDPALY
jgi:hypothetical protein